MKSKICKRLILRAAKHLQVLRKSSRKTSNTQNSSWGDGIWRTQSNKSNEASSMQLGGQDLTDGVIRKPSVACEDEATDSTGATCLESIQERVQGWFPNVRERQRDDMTIQRQDAQDCGKIFIREITECFETSIVAFDSLQNDISVASEYPKPGANFNCFIRTSVS